MSKQNKDYYGDDCTICESMLEKGKSIKQVNADHKDCHGWIHCDPECCGSCYICGR